MNINFSANLIYKLILAFQTTIASLNMIKATTTANSPSIHSTTINSRYEIKTTITSTPNTLIKTIPDIFKGKLKYQ